MKQAVSASWKFGKRLIEDRFFRNTVLLTALNILGSLVNYVWQIFTNRNLDPAQYGLLNALLASTAIFSIFGDIFYQWSLKGYTELAAHGRSSGLGRLTRYFMARIGVVCGALILVACVGIFVLPDTFKVTSFDQGILLSALLFLSFANILPCAFLDSIQRFNLHAISGFIGAIVRVGFLALLLLGGLTITKAMTSQLMSMLSIFILVTAASLLIARRLPGRGGPVGPPPSSQELLYFFRIGLSSIFLTFILNQDMLLARMVLDPVASGQWATLSVFGKAVFFAATAPLPILFVAVTGHFHKRLPYGQAFAKSLAGVGGMALLGTMGLAIFIQPFVQFLNPAYRTLVPEILFFALGTLPYIFIKFFTVFFISVNRFRLFAPLLVLGFIQIGLYAALGSTVHRFLWLRAITGLLILAAMVAYFLYKKGRFYPTDGDAEQSHG